MFLRLRIFQLSIKYYYFISPKHFIAPIPAEVSRSFLISHSLLAKYFPPNCLGEDAFRVVVVGPLRVYVRFVRLTVRPLPVGEVDFCRIGPH